MTSLQAIRDKVNRRQYEFSRHAVDQSILRDIGVTEVEEAVLGDRPLLKVITLYEPDPDHWVDLRKRKDAC